jgi:hypothetical protein
MYKNKNKNKNIVLYKIFGVFYICSEVSRSVIELGTGAADPRTKKTIQNIVTLSFNFF